MTHRQPTHTGLTQQSEIDVTGSRVANQLAQGTARAIALTPGTMAPKGKRHAAAPAASCGVKAAASAAKKRKSVVSVAQKLCHISALGRPLDVISHCSGWLSESQALDRLGIPHAVRMASDNNPAVRRFLAKNYAINYWQDDITDAPVSEMPAGDLFVSGFPCQPFSQAGKNLGAKDARAQPMAVLMEYIADRSPHIVVLENVANFQKKHVAVLNRFLRYLQGLGTYYAYHRVLNTLDYGVPQHRERFYLVLIKKRLLRLQFTWPETTPCTPHEQGLRQELCWSDQAGGVHRAETAEGEDIRHQPSEQLQNHQEAAWETIVA